MEEKIKNFLDKAIKKQFDPALYSELLYKGEEILKIFSILLNPCK